jgi:hypothetical protein
MAAKTMTKTTAQKQKERGAVCQDGGAGGRRDRRL